MSGARTPGGQDTQADGTPRRPYWLVGMVIFAVIAVLLGGAFALDRALRPTVGIAPVAGSSDGTPPSTSAEARTPSSPTIPTPIESAATTNPVAAVQSPEQAVEQAYLRYWEMYSAALLDLDASRLGEVATGDELRRIRDEIAGYQRAGYAVRVRVTHDYLLVDVTATEARLVDEIVDRSFRVDPVTKDPPQGPEVGTTVRDLFVLQKSDGIWKVSRSIRESR